MPVFLLGDEIAFPPVDSADENGVLAIGGDLETERLILAYRSGIFPWYSDGEPIIWHAPDPRFVLFPGNLKISKSMKKVFRDKTFRITIDQAFDMVIKKCKNVRRKEQEESWITDEMLTAYQKLHREGIAHSVEAWKEKELVGGLYGLIIGSCFFGESMFSEEPNASKAAFITLVKNTNFEIIDCQVYTSHLKSLGARYVNRKKYMKLLDNGLRENVSLISKIF